MKMAGNTQIELHSMILNGKPDEDTVRELEGKGHIIVGEEKAEKFHPYSLPADTIIFYAKPIDKEAYDQWLEDVNAYKTANGYAANSTR